ncbi:MAG: hypothetical protein HY518_01820 [Candidatus Aenigmarchaeota archaeon]|nr:hypothetical protein [Candidatus Aenigmarchaeota archaeon]
MAKGDALGTVGSWAFLIGALVAVVAGVIPGLNTGSTQVWVTSAIVLLGLVVGFLNVTSKETMHYLMAAVSLVLVSTFGGDVLAGIETVGPVLQAVLNNVILFTVPAVIVVSLKAIYSVASEE